MPNTTPEYGHGEAYMWKCPKCGFQGNSDHEIARHAFPNWHDVVAFDAGKTSEQRKKQIAEMASDAKKLLKTHDGKQRLAALCIQDN